MSAYSSIITAESSLVSWWQLGEPTGTSAADSKGANTGTYTGGFTLAQPPIPGDAGGGSVKLNGTTGHVSIGTPATSLPSTGAYSLEAWVKIPSGTTMSSAQGIIGYGNYGGGNQVNALKFNAAPTAVTNYWWANDQNWTLLKDVGDGLWHHLVATWDGSTRFMYMDGFLVAAGIAATGRATTQQNLRIGNNNSEFFPVNGLITQVAVYNAALSLEQVAQHWEAGIGKRPVRAWAKPGTRSMLLYPTLDFYVPCSEALPTDLVMNRQGTYTGGSVNPTVVNSPWGKALNFTLNSKQLTWADQRTANREGPWTLFALVRINSSLDVVPNRAGIVSTGTASAGALVLQYSAGNGNEISLLKAGTSIFASPKFYAQFGNWSAIAATWDGKSLHNFYAYDMETGLYVTAAVTDTNLSSPGAINPSIGTAPSSGYLDADMVVAGIDRLAWTQARFFRFVADPFYPMRPPIRPALQLAAQTTTSSGGPVVIVTSSVSATGTGRPGQGHLVYAANTAKWWLFYLASTQSLAALNSTNFSSWSAPTGSPLALAVAHGSEGRNFGFAYASLASADVVHASLAYSGGSNNPRHARFTLGASAWTISNVEAGIDASYFTGAVCGNNTGLSSANQPFDSYLDTGGNRYVNNGSNNDGGTSWTAGFAAKSGALNGAASVDSESGAFASLGSGNMLLVFDKGGPAGSMTGPLYQTSTAGTWSTATNTVGTASPTSVNNWGLVGRTTSDVHVVWLADNNGAYTHMRFNGATWVAGDVLPGLVMATISGVLLATDGTSVWAFVIDSSGNVQQSKWVSGTGWTAWSIAVAAGANPRSYLSGHQTVVGGNVGLIWTETRSGPAYDIAGALVNVSGAAASTAGGASLLMGL